MPGMALVRSERRGVVALIELTRPESGNALSNRLIDELTRAVATPGAGARALLLAGAGRHFCAGADLSELALERAEEDRIADAMRLAALYAALLRSPLITVAAVHGAASGGGAGLAACCDLVIAGPAARIQFSETRLGFVPALISVFLPRRIAAARLARLFLDPEPLGAEAAREVGLVDEIADDPVAAGVARALDLTRKVAASAVAETKRLLLESAIPALDARLADAARVNARQRAHPECRRGLAEFLETKQFPTWTE